MPGSVQFLERSHAFRFLRRQILLRRGGGARLVRPERRVDLPEFESNLRAMVETLRARGAVPILLTTPLRPGIPLIENEVLAQEPGGAEWVTQDWWVSRQLAARGVQPQTPAGTAALRQVLDDGLRLHPDWPWLHYLRARELAIHIARVLDRIRRLDDKWARHSSQSGPDRERHHAGADRDDGGQDRDREQTDRLCPQAGA